MTAITTSVAAGPGHTSRGQRSIWMLAVAVALLLLCGLSVAIGARDVSWGDIVAALGGHNDTIGQAAVLLRLPRTALAIMAGGALGLAGAVMQGVTRNPLADPGIMGVNTGAALAVVIGVAWFNMQSTSAFVWVAIAGAACSAIFVYTVGSLGRSGATPLKLALAGAATSIALNSLIIAVVLPRNDIAGGIRSWQIGGVGGASLDRIVPALPFILIGAVVSMLCARSLNSLALGDDLAASLGARVALTRALGGLGAILLCGATTAACGPIGFVGLVVPHLCRLRFGSDYRWLLPFSAIGGATLLLFADITGRVIARPAELDVDIFDGVHRRASLCLDRAKKPAAGAVKMISLSFHAERRRANGRHFRLVAMLVAVIGAVFTLSLSLGQSFTPLDQVVRALLGENIPGVSFTIGQLRLPRAVMCILAGVSFGMAGASFQTMLRNPLASPDIIGISSGASAAAVFAIVVLAMRGPMVSLFAVSAGLGVAMLVYCLSLRNGVAGSRLILVGIGVSAMLESFVAYILTQAPEWNLQEAMRWLTGSVNGAQLGQALPLLAVVMLCGGTLLALARSIEMLRLGDDMAAALGVQVSRVRALVILCSVGLIATATAVTGPIAFVAFLSGPIASRIFGSGRSILLPAACIGALLVLLGDYAGQYLLPSRYPVGVITGALGAPYLIYLIIRVNRSGGTL